MKKQTIKGLAFIVVASSMATSCKLMKDITYTITPNPLEMHGDSVRISAEISLPEKGIKKKVTAEITPMLVTTALKPITIQGEKVTGNGNSIQYKPGGTVKYSDIVLYKPEFESVDLTVVGTVKKGKKEKPMLAVKKVADGTIVTPLLVNKDFKVILEKDAFNRVTEKGFSAQFNFERGKSVIKPAELKEKDIADFKVWCDENGVPIIGIDNLPISKELETTKLPKKCVLFFGQEGAGMSDEAVDICETVLAIRQYGSTRSMNASAAGAIAMYAWAMQHLNN